MSQTKITMRLLQEIRIVTVIFWMNLRLLWILFNSVQFISIDYLILFALDFSKNEVNFTSKHLLQWICFNSAIAMAKHVFKFKHRRSWFNCNYGCYRVKACWTTQSMQLLCEKVNKSHTVAYAGILKGGNPFKSYD